MPDIENHDFDSTLRQPDDANDNGIIGRVEDRLKVDVGESGPLITIPGLVALTSRIRQYDRDVYANNQTPVITASYLVPVGKTFELFLWHSAAEGAEYLATIEKKPVVGVNEEIDAARAVSANVAARTDIEYVAAPVRFEAGETCELWLREIGNNREFISGFNGIVFDA